ncbi:MAG: ankyrin repeat domain-containing protein, partial [Woeseia sp.]|nr:ankyrin repeat domain-containing protein [Woeseia sp.]
MKNKLLILVLLSLHMTTLKAAISPLVDAASRGDIETVQQMLRAGADVSAAQGDGMT